MVGRPDEMKGQAVAAFVTLEMGHKPSPELKEELRQWVAKEIGSMAKPDDIRFTDQLAQDALGQDHAAPAARAGLQRRSERRHDHAGRSGRDLALAAG